jgi:threonine aldolase
LPNASRANRLAQTLSLGLQKSNRVRLSNPTQANEVFAMMPRKTFDAVTEQGAHFYEWPIEGLNKDEVHCRFVLSFATPESHVEQFLKLMRDHG